MKLVRAALLLGTGSVLVPGFCFAESQKAEDIVAKVTETGINLMRQNLRDQKKPVIAANLPLTGDEAAKFWTAYDAYTQETIKVNDLRYGLVKEYSENYTTMTDAQAGSYIRRWISADQAASKLRLERVPKFEGVLGVQP